MSSSVTAASALAQIQGTIVLAGAGKMGGAMLSGWLARGLDPKRVAVIEPYPSQEITGLRRQASASIRRQRRSAPPPLWWSR